MPLTDVVIRKARPEAKPRKLADGGGLYLLLNPDGARWWRLKYRFAGKEKLLSLGTYPDTSLGEARERRDAARKLLANGVDPGVQRKAEKARSAELAANTFEAVAREWYAVKSVQLVPSYRSKVLARIEGDLLPLLGKRPVAELTAPEILKALRRIEDRGANETAHRVLQTCGQVFRYAVATGLLDADPTAALRGALAPVQGSHHAAITDPVALGGLLRAVDGYDGHLATRYALQLAALLFVRPGELRHAEWAEFDLQARQWCIPAVKMKMREDHIVPLSDQAIAILKQLETVSGNRQYLFPSVRSPKRAMSDNTLNAALRRLGYATTSHTAHGFRATARTLLDEVLHFRPDYIEHQLAHAVRDPNGRAYNRTAHLPERRKMMQAWADYLERLRKDDPKVVPIKRTA
ncbi:MAG: integrase arm-type DNA-binding domain-containing protein [Pseudoxanthomonas sp.]